MNQLHEGWDYKLYQVYIWGGLLFIVGHILISILVFEADKLPGPQAYLTIVGPLLVWVAGILLYWWWVLLFKGSKELAQLVQEGANEVPGIQSLKSLNSLHQALAINGGNAAELFQNAKEARRPGLIWYGCLNLLAIWVLGFITLGALELLPAEGPFGLGMLVFGVVGWCVGMIILTPLLGGWGGRKAEEAYLAPLGLAVTQVPSLKFNEMSLLGGGQTVVPDGAAVVEGERHGRLVYIEMIDKDSLTAVQAAVPEFTVQSNDGKLTASNNAPEAVAVAIKSLRKAKRWQGVEVQAGSEGITIQRQSKKTDMWLYDLWLAEYLLDKIDVG
ncbi:MAG: hypothetical protein KDE51_25435 [Anaerolineales bacterium]|nr:hypothetical protein [Anaerolineales bacterium]